MLVYDNHNVYLRGRRCFGLTALSVSHFTTHLLPNVPASMCYVPDKVATSQRDWSYGLPKIVFTYSICSQLWPFGRIFLLKEVKNQNYCQLSWHQCVTFTRSRCITARLKLVFSEDCIWFCPEITKKSMCTWTTG